MSETLHLKPFIAINKFFRVDLIKKETCVLHFTPETNELSKQWTELDNFVTGIEKLSSLKLILFEFINNLIDFTEINAI